jgi:hypothetical protein
MGKDAKRAQKAAQKRKAREKLVTQTKARRRARQEGSGERSLLTQLGTFPVYECVISKGWRDRGLAHILLARRAPDGTLLAGGYYVDVLCVGLKDTAVISKLSDEDYRERVKPNVFNDPVEFEPCQPGLARALVEGAIAFAETAGLRPNKRWNESRRVFDGIDPEPGGLEFGRNGRPCLVIRKGENWAAVRARLDRKLGVGKYEVRQEG